MSHSIRLRIISVLLLFFSGWTGLCGAEAEAPTKDTLVYKDGDRIHGRLISSTPELIVFESGRFGRIRVTPDQAVVIKAEPAVAAVPPGPPVAPVPPAKAAADRAAEREEVEKASRWEHLYPAVLAARLREVFGSWHGRVAFATEAVSDTADRTNLSLEMGVKRKWKRDEVQLNGRYDYSETNELTTTDLVKGDGLWRHDFGKNSFAQYRPTLEWNRASFRDGLPSDYVLLQQEVGVGMNLLATSTRKLRLGLSENLFDVWTTSPPASHSSRTSESLFVETELKLPWGLLLTDRGVYYYSFSSRGNGWENRVELTKKFTETLSTAIRHEMRRGSPDGRAQDYTRLRLLLGLDF
jgi:hypothetical protein